MPEPTVEGLQSLLFETIEILAHRSTDMWRPAFGSCKARDEAAETEAYLRLDHQTWGRGPLEVVWKGSSLFYLAILEHVRAAAALMQAPHRFWSAAVEARVAVEASAQVRWLLDSELPDGRTRVGRYYTMYLYSSRQLERTHLRTQSDEPVEVYGRTSAHMQEEAAALGLVPVPNKHQEVIGYEGQKWPAIDKLVEEVIGNTGGYPVLSGAAHAEFWSLLGAYREGDPSAFGISAGQNQESIESFKLVTLACMNALLIPAREAWYLFRRELLANDLLRIAQLARPLLGEL